MRLHDCLFLDAQPDAGGKDFIEGLNPNSLKVVTVIVEPSLGNAKAGQQIQFERQGYSVADRIDHVQGTKAVFDLALGVDGFLRQTKPIDLGDDKTLRLGLWSSTA